MLYIKDPFTPIYRLARAIPSQYVRADCFDHEGQRFVVVALLWSTISSDDAGELARVMLNPEGYQPSLDEFRWWVDNNA